ncbi:hypothetical protein [Nocardiopsis oceani]
MGVATKLGLYAAGLVVVFAAAFGVGSMVGPVLSEPPEGHSESVERPVDSEQDHDGDNGAEH